MGHGQSVCNENIRGSHLECNSVTPQMGSLINLRTQRNTPRIPLAGFGKINVALNNSMNDFMSDSEVGDDESPGETSRKYEGTESTE
ncbi:hypothetical protein AVEN_18534-1 [Araneus ventricosus]|uniref:Uncharacterized protein n=1 Tax=Araneus ventricosus TaxID=182803 RepID=A0A4Y2S8L9_ARAVE|nr:hypothetical protein AVEN_18534-1 [Araneus ventricosus]